MEAQEPNKIKRFPRGKEFPWVLAIILGLLSCSGVLTWLKSTPKHEISSIHRYEIREQDYLVKYTQGQAYLMSEEYMFWRIEWHKGDGIEDWSEIWAPKTMIKMENTNSQKMDFEHISRDQGHHVWRVNEQLIKFPEGQRKMILIKKDGKFVELGLIQEPD